MSAPASSATSSASAVERPQILTMSDMNVPHRDPRIRRGLSKLPPFYIPARALSCTRLKRFSPHRRLAAAAVRAARPLPGCRTGVRGALEPIDFTRAAAPTSRSSRRAVRRHLPCRSQAAMPPITTPRINRHDDQREQRQRHRGGGCAALNGSSETVTILAVGHRKGNDDDAERHENSRRDDLAEQRPALDRAAPVNLRSGD